MYNKKESKLPMYSESQLKEWIWKNLHMRSGDWVNLTVPVKDGWVMATWKILEYPIFEQVFGLERDAAKIHNEKYGELITPIKYLQYDNYPEAKLIRR